MSEQTIAAAMTTPDKHGAPALPKRNAPKGMLLSSWVSRELRIAYVVCYDSGQETSCALLDFYLAGPVLNIRGGRTQISWGRLVLCELVEG
jgi:hypothetical protein